jgi:hypothetical protein
MKRATFFAVVFGGELAVLYLTGTDDTREGLAEIVTHPVVQVVLCVGASCFVAVLARAAYRRHEPRSAAGLLHRWDAERRARRASAEATLRDFLLNPATIEPASPADESRGPLPDEWHAPCGELVHLSTTNNSGPRAA